MEFTCNGQYLGRVEAFAPKIGTLENAARLYQKGCYDLKDRKNMKVKVTPKSISLQDQDGSGVVFSIKSTLFCATYKKIPRVVAFNYLCKKEPSVIECHAIYLGSFVEAQNFVRAVTAAFTSAYSTNNAVNSEPENVAEKSQIISTVKNVHEVNKHLPWVNKIADAFGMLNKKKISV